MSKTFIHLKYITITVEAFVGMGFLSFISLT